jgi:hypothetical protein
MSSSDSSCIETLNNTIIYLNRYIIPVFYILGNVGNLLSMLIFAKKSWRKNVCVFYFNICLVSNSFYINSAVLVAFFSDFNINPYNSISVLCKLYFYVVFLVSTLLPTVLILASIDRLLISSQNVDTRLYSSKRLAYFSVSINTVFWLIFFVHILIKVNIQEIYPSEFVCYYDLSQFYLNFVSYCSLIVNFLFCLIMIVLCMFAFKNVRRIRNVPQQQRKQIRTMTKKDFQLLRCLFAQDIVYIIFSIGLSISTVYQAATMHQMQTPLEQAINTFFYNLSIFLHHVPYCASFYIFVAVSKAFRNELKRMVYKICRKDIMLIREEENKQENVGRDNVELNVAVVNHIVS